MSSIRLTTKDDNVLFNILLTATIVLPFITYLDLRPFIAGPISNIQVVKSVVAYFFCCMFVFYCLYSKGIPKNNFKSLSLLLFYFSIHILVTPQFNVQLLNQNVSGIWIARDFNEILLFYIMVMGISAINWTEDKLNRLFNIICHISFICSVYIFFQYLGLDQWNDLINNTHTINQTNCKIVSFLGQSTFAGTFLALTLPFMICNKKIFYFITTLVAIGLTGSLTAYLMVAVVAFLYLIFRCGNIIRGILLCLVGLSLPLVLVLRNKILPFVLHESSGRVGAWESAIKQTLSSPFPEIKTTIFTGYGLGSYEFILKNLSSSGFVELHNEFLEVLCNAGVIGFTLLILSLFMLIRNIYTFNIVDRHRFAAICCFFSVCVGNLIHFMWQLDPHRFYISVMLGIILNQINKENKDV